MNIGVHLPGATSTAVIATIVGEVEAEIAITSEVAVGSVMTSDMVDGENDREKEIDPGSDSRTVFEVLDMPSTRQNCWQLLRKMRSNYSIATI